LRSSTSEKTKSIFYRPSTAVSLCFLKFLAIPSYCLLLSSFFHLRRTQLKHFQRRPWSLNQSDCLKMLGVSRMSLLVAHHNLCMNFSPRSSNSRCNPSIRVYFLTAKSVEVIRNFSGTCALLRNTGLSRGKPLRIWQWREK
jgi:hypothetical protein